MTEKNGSRESAARGRHTYKKGRKTPPDHEPFAVRVERFRRLLADLIARQFAEKQRHSTARKGRFTRPKMM